MHICVVPDQQSIFCPEVQVYHGPIRMNQQDAQSKLLRKELLNLKKKIDGAINVNKPRIQLEAGLNEISVA